MACDNTLDPFQAEKSGLEVSEKYIQLMQDTLNEDSLYMRAKDTMKVQFDNLNISAEEKAKLVSEHVATMTTNLSSVAMQTALSWAKEERDGAYTLAKLKADAEIAIAQAAKLAEEICLVKKQTDLACANITSTISGSIRENGYVLAYEADGCVPKTMDETGFKYNQTKQVIAATYQIHADAYRKSGVVQIGTDQSDNIIKGLSGGIAPITDGYTNQQSLNAERQRVGYEDSKATHAANSASTMIGQLLSSQTLSEQNKQDIIRWRTSVDRLLTKGESMTDIPDDYTPPADT